MAEKVIRYMEEKLRQKDSVVEKLRLKNASLKSQIQKVDLQLRQKEEMGDVLHYIDFHQLGIENKQYMAKIEERNQELLKLKMTTGNTVQVLNNLKRKLNDLIDDSELLKREIKAHTDGPSGLIKIKEVRTRRGVNHRHYRAIIAMPHSPTPFAPPTHPTPHTLTLPPNSRSHNVSYCGSNASTYSQDNARVQQEIEREREINQKLKLDQEDAVDSPQVLDYVAQKAEMYELQGAVKNWQRKVRGCALSSGRALRGMCAHVFVGRRVVSWSVANYRGIEVYTI